MSLSFFKHNFTELFLFYRVIASTSSSRLWSVGLCVETIPQRVLTTKIPGQNVKEEPRKLRSTLRLSIQV